MHTRMRTSRDEQSCSRRRTKAQRTDVRRILSGAWILLPELPQLEKDDLCACLGFAQASGHRHVVGRACVSYGIRDIIGRRIDAVERHGSENLRAITPLTTSTFRSGFGVNTASVYRLSRRFPYCTLTRSTVIELGCSCRGKVGPVT